MQFELMAGSFFIGCLAVVNKLESVYQRINSLKRKGILALTPDEKREIQSLNALIHQGSVKSNQSGVIVIHAKYDNNCRGCGRRIKAGYEMKLDKSSKQAYCLSCEPKKTPVKTIKLSPADIDAYLRT